MAKKLVALLVALSAAFALAACSEEGAHDGHAESGIAESEEFNQADVTFATDMIQHHAQALTMVDLTVDREVSPELTRLAEQIREAQGPEIEIMVDWLTEWDQPIPATSRDHVNAEGHGDMEGDMEMDTDMPGMMSAEEMAELEAAEGEAFEQLWIEMMIEHHEGAIEMASTELAEGEYPDAVALAEAIISAQEAEIDQMESLLGS